MHDKEKQKENSDCSQQPEQEKKSCVSGITIETGEINSILQGVRHQLDETIANADRILANHEAYEREREERRLKKMEHDIFVLRCKTSICIGFVIGLMIAIVQLQLGLFEI